MDVEPTECAAGHAPAPCDGCAQRPRCAAERLACSAFAFFVGGQRWKSAARNPTASRFARIYASDDDARHAPHAATQEKIDALRELRGDFGSLSAVLKAVGLAHHIYQRLAAADPALAAHARALVKPVVRTPRGAPRPPPRRADLRLRILGITGAQRSRNAVAVAANCNVNTLRRYVEQYPEVAQHVAALLATARGSDAVPQ